VAEYILEWGVQLNLGADVKKCIEVYEAEHAVEEYVVRGWHVWPLLKMIPYMGYLPATAPSINQTTSFRRRLAIRLPWLQQSYRWLKYHWGQRVKHGSTGLLDAEHNDPHDAQRQIIILTLSERRVLIGGTLYEPYSDPLVEQLHKLGRSTLVWEQGANRGPRYSKSARISWRMDAECRRLSLSRHSHEGPEPAWFTDYQKFTNEIMGRPVIWREVSSLIDAVSNRSVVFERWLRKTGARFLFVVCWYDPFVMAAIMAARHCGIKTIELQHGVGGAMDFAYTSWLRSPHEGYEVIPDIFWRWGKVSAEEVRHYNPAFSTKPEIVAGGNLWLNHFRRNMRPIKTHYSSAGQLAPCLTKTILVTLQLDIEPLLLDAIGASPSTWQWLIRFHPSRSKSQRIRDVQLLRNTGHPGIDLERANHLMLYDLLCESDVHVTGYSACAIEALAFGVTTIVINELGRLTFSEFIKQGLIISADTSDKLIEEIEHSQRINPDDAPYIANMFASDDDARNALRLIMSNDS
jgi:hypothetical protein